MRLIFLGLVFLGACATSATPCTPTRNAGAGSGAPVEAVVQAQLEAYNRRDVEAFASTYAPDVRIFDHPDRLQMSGVDELRREYTRLFASAPNLHARVSQRIVQGEYVIDHETVTGLPGGAQIQAGAIYQVCGGKIQNVWFIR